MPVPRGSDGRVAAGKPTTLPDGTINCRRTEARSVRDPLVLDAGLLVVGGSLAFLTGMILYADGGRPVVPVVAAGVALTLVCAVLVRQYWERLAAVADWFAGPAETPSGRLRYGLLILGALVVRLFVLPLLPAVTLHGFAGSTATMAVLGGGRALVRTLGESHG